MRSITDTAPTATTTPRRRKSKLPQYVFACPQKDGTTRYRSWVPTGTNGGKKWTHRFATPEEALSVRVELMKLDRETPRDEITLALGVARVAERLKRDRRPGTHAWFAHHAKLLEQELGSNTVLNSITGHDIEAFRDKQAKRVGASTLRHYRSALSLIFNGSKRDLRGKNPLDDVDGWPTVETKERSFFKAEEVTDLVERIRTSGKPHADEDADLLALLFLTGLRRSELARLRVQDVDLESRTMFIAGKRGNTPAPLGEEARAVLARTIARVKVGPLVPGGANHVSKVFQRWSDRLDESRLSAHSMRHSFVSALVRAGHGLPVVQKLARHRTVAMTMKYFHSTAEDAAALDSLSVASAGRSKGPRALPKGPAKDRKSEATTREKAKRKAAQ